MKRSTNPYTPGAGKRPAKLAGRDPDLENFALLLERLGDGRHERSMIFAGLRGIGKTVLLLEFDILAGEAQWFSTGVQEVGSNADFRTSMARLALRLLRSMSLRQRMKDRARAALSVVKAFSLDGPVGIRLQLDVDAATGSADTGDIEQDLADLLVEIGEVARAGGAGALFLIDEMQNLDRASLGALCMALHRVSQRDLPVALAGAGLPTLPTMLRAAKPYVLGFFAPAFELATDAEQRYLIAISSLGDGPYRTADAAHAAGYANIGGASVVREELIEKELVWSPRRGFIDFTVPRFAPCLRTTH